MTEPTLFDQVAATEAREAAIEQVEQNAAEQFMHCALRSVYLVALHASQGTWEFTTDDVVAYMLEHYPEVTTHEPRAWGAVMRKAVTKGWIINTGRVRPSTMVSNHRRPKTIWRVPQ